MNVRAVNQNKTVTVIRDVSLADSSGALYFREIGREKLLSTEQEWELFRQMESGVVGAKDRLIRAQQFSF
jgi:hypothetical protein